MCERCTTVSAELYRFHKEFTRLRPGGDLELDDRTEGGVQNEELPADEYLSMMMQSHLRSESESSDYYFRPPLNSVQIEVLRDRALEHLSVTEGQKSQLKMSPGIKLHRLEDIGRQ